jgi:DNA polymerase-3 subunit gamma/tau
MYQVLARKYRPRNFSQLVGQTHVSRALSSALEHGRLHHAYIFTGTRGVGKTTIARILAKCLNCETGITATPCEVCATCVAINQGRFIDLIEIDAASRTKVEDTRELLDNVPYAPTQGRYKVYLIDEVHMLSTHSFNALLKTLEEPPEHVKFLLATTDPQKLPITVLSRCLQFTLRPLPQQEIHDHLANVLDKENIGFDDKALWQLAEVAQGSLRDALSLTDQAIAYGQGKVSGHDVQEMLGLLDKALILHLLNAIHANHGNTVSQILQNFANQAIDLKAVLDQLITLIHQIALVQILPQVPLQGTQEFQAQLRQQAAQISATDIQLYYQIALQGRQDLKYAVSLQQGFDMCILRMLAFKPLAMHEHIDVPEDEVQPPVQSVQPLVQMTASVQESYQQVVSHLAPVQQPQVHGAVHVEVPYQPEAVASDNEDNLQPAFAVDSVVQQDKAAEQADDAVTEPLQETVDGDVAITSDVEDEISAVVHDQHEAQQQQIEASDVVELEVEAPLLQSIQPESSFDEQSLFDEAMFNEPLFNDASADNIATVMEPNVPDTDLFSMAAPVQKIAPEQPKSLQAPVAVEPTVVQAAVVQAPVVVAEAVKETIQSHSDKTPQQILQHEHVELLGDWTVEKWECWLREADISPAIRNLAQHGIMQGEIGGVCSFVISAEHRLLATELLDSMLESLKQHWPNILMQLDLSEPEAVIPLQRKAIRQEQAEQQAEYLLKKEPTVAALIRQFNGTLTNITLAD